MTIKEIINLKIPMVIDICVIVIFVLFIWGRFSSSVILKPSNLPIGVTPVDLRLDSENVSFKTVDGINIDGWFIQPAGISVNKQKPIAKSTKTIIICHGFGTNKSDVLSSMSFLVNDGFNLLFFDFRNHGKSGGKISSLGKLEMYDLEAAVDFLKKEKPEFSEKIGVLGISMGGSVAIIAAANYKRINAVVADSPFSSFKFIVLRYAKLFYKMPEYPLMPVTFLFTRVRLGFNPMKGSAIDCVSKISPRPIFFIHGKNDERIPVSESVKLYNLAGEPKQLWLVDGADHMESHMLASAEYEQKVGDFFKKYLK